MKKMSAVLTVLFVSCLAANQASAGGWPIF